MSPINERGAILVINQSVMSISFILGPMIGGFVYEIGGVTSPFFVSAILLMVATVIGIKIATSVEPSSIHMQS